MSQYEWTTSEAPGKTPIVNSIFDFSAEALGQLKVWLEQAGLAIPINQVVGYSQGLQVLDRSSSTVDVASTASETSIYSKQVNARTMGTDKVLRLLVCGDYLHDTAPANVNIRVKFGGTTHINAPTLVNTTSANREPWALRITVANQASSSSQFVIAEMLSVDPSSTTTTGIGTFSMNATSVPAGGVVGISSLAAIDTTVNQTLEVTAQWDASSASNSWRKRYALLELV